VPSSAGGLRFSSTVIPEAGATETVPIPVAASSAGGASSAAPVSSSAAAGSRTASYYPSGGIVASATSYTGPSYTGAARVNQPVGALLAGAMAIVAMV
jgi:hypothetical protein